MAKKLNQQDLLKLSSINTPPTDSVAFAAKSDGLYQKIGTVESKLSTTAELLDRVKTPVPLNALFTDTKYTHPTSAGNKHIPTGGATNQILRYSASGTAVWSAEKNTTYGAVTTSTNGLMIAADKVKLNGIAEGANNYVHPSGVYMSSAERTKLGGIAASANNYSLPIASDTTLGGVKVGSRLSIASGVLSATQQTANDFTTALKNKLDGIASNANNYSHPSSHPATMITGLHASATTGVAGSVAWDNVSGKPSTFAPAAHTHSNISITAGTGLSGGGALSATRTLSIASTYTPNTSTSLGASKNLNDYRTAGFYHQTSNANATTALNYPVASAGALLVETAAGVIQTYKVYNSSNVYVRGYYGTTWTAWRKLVNTSDSIPWARITGAPATATTHPTWAQVTGKPSTFAPSSHTHTWAQVTSKPSTFAPSTHTHTSAQISDATNLNTASMIVKRDSSGNFSAGTITAALTGNASSATKLATARTINGTSFDGTANITTANWGTARNIGVVNSDGTGTAVTTSVNGSANVNLKLPATIKASLTGNASSATNLSRSILAGNGLTGGGTLNANRTITLGTPSTLTASTTNAVATSSHTHAITTTSVGAANTIIQTDASGGTKLGNLTIGGWSLLTEYSGTNFSINYGGATKMSISTVGSGVVNFYSDLFIQDNLTAGSIFSESDVRAYELIAYETVTTPQISFGNGFTIEPSGTELVFKYNGVIKQRFLSDGTILGTGGITALSTE